MWSWVLFLAPPGSLGQVMYALKGLISLSLQMIHDCLPYEKFYKVGFVSALYN